MASLAHPRRENASRKPSSPARVVVCLLFILLSLILPTSIANGSDNVNGGSSFPEEKILADLLRWMNKRGYPSLEAVSVIVGSDELATTAVASRREMSVVAARDIAEGESVMSLPSSVFISSRGTATDVMPFDVDQILSQAPPSQDTAWVEYVLLAAWLLRQRAAGSASPWQPYIALLPSYVASPATFPDYIVKEFESPEFTQGVDAFRSFMSQIYHMCDRSALAGASLPDFLWAVLIALSRSFRMAGGDRQAGGEAALPTSARREGGEAGERERENAPASDQGLSYVLVPFADFLNHAPDFNLLLAPGANGSLHLTAVRDITAGEPLTFSYGTKPNSLLLLNYGFLMEDNPYDSAMLAGTVADLASMVLALLQAGRQGGMGGLEAGESEDGTRQWLEGVGERAIEAVQRAREAASQSEDWAQWAFSPQFHIEGNEPFAVFGNGAVDPRALAALTAMWHALLFQNEVEYERVASAATWFGWSTSDTSCSEISGTLGMSEAEALSLKGAAGLIVQVLNNTVNAFRSTMEEDKAELVLLRECLKWVTTDRSSKPYATTLDCPGDVATWGYAREKAMLFRVEKKKILRSVSERISNECAFELQNDEDLLYMHDEL